MAHLVILRVVLFVCAPLNRNGRVLFGSRFWHSARHSLIPASRTVRNCKPTRLILQGELGDPGPPGPPIYLDGEGVVISGTSVRF